MTPGPCWTRFIHSCFVAIMLIFSAGALPALAQQQPPLEQPQLQPEQQQTPEADQSPDIKTDPRTSTSNDRLFWALPNFLAVENAGRTSTLSRKDKFKLVTRGTFDPVEFPFYAFLSGISQAENSEPGFGQGAAGYGKRFGATFADGTIENFMAQAVFPSLLREDPRYYQLGKGTFWRRAGYSISRTFITRTDSGHTRFNYSEVLGGGVAAVLSNAYHPRGDRTVVNTLSVWGTDIGWDTVSTVLKEFWPDIRRKAHRHSEAGD